MTKFSKTDKRQSFNSMYQYDIPNSNKNGYHSKYLKLVGATIALTFIGILIFIQLQKPATSAQLGADYEDHTPADLPEFHSVLDIQRMSQPTKSKLFNSNLVPGFRQRQWQTVGFAISSKENDLRRKLKKIQLLISDLKYFPR